MARLQNSRVVTSSSASCAGVALDFTGRPRRGRPSCQFNSLSTRIVLRPAILVRDDRRTRDPHAPSLPEEQNAREHRSRIMTRFSECSAVFDGTTAPRCSALHPQIGRQVPAEQRAGKFSFLSWGSQCALGFPPTQFRDRSGQTRTDCHQVAGTHRSAGWCLRPCPLPSPCNPS